MKRLFLVAGLVSSLAFAVSPEDCQTTPNPIDEEGHLECKIHGRDIQFGLDEQKLVNCRKLQSKDMDAECTSGGLVITLGEFLGVK